MLTVGHAFPEFRCHSVTGPDADSIRLITNADTAGKWAVFAFYPKDFTFVCPTELVELNKQLEEFDDRDTLVFGASTDNEYSHLAWCKDHEDLRELKYPLLGAQKLASDLGILDPVENVCLRATYIVNPEGGVEYASVTSLNVGRNVDEILRVLDAAQSGELCPCNWKKGDEPLAV
ncbi:MAG: peroxiredoxin [Planctomycetota bacterium]